MKKIITIILVSFSLFGCQNYNKITTSAQFDIQTENTNKRAQKLSEEITKVPGVDKASVALNDNSAIVAIEIREMYDENAIVTLKNTVKNVVKNYDKRLDRVSVSVSKELLERISKNTNPQAVDGPIHPDSAIGKIIEQLTPTI